MSFQNNDDAQGRAERPSVIPTVNPWARAPEPSAPSPPPPPQQPAAAPGKWWFSWSSVAFAVVLFGSLGIRAYEDLSRPEAWAYWKDLYVSPSMSASLIPHLDADGSGRSRPALAISGTFGPATASWFREKLDDAKLAPGDTVLLSSPGGNLSQAMIMGEIIRARGLVTAVGTADASGRIKPSYCASACVMAYAGGKVRIGIDGSGLGVHRFVSPAPGPDPVADTQRTTGIVLSYMTKMGIASSVVEAMSATEKIRWLGAREAAAMNLITDPARKS